MVNIDNPEEYNYQLDNNPPQEDFVFENVTPGLHSVTVTSNTGCGSQVVDNILAVSAAENLIMCVPMGNSVGEFNLTENAENVLQGLNPADYSIAYYNGTPDSGNPNGLITNPENYTCIFPGQVIHARVSSISNPDIYADAAFVLIVGPVPPYVVTDDLLVSDDNFDGYTMFDLTVTIPQILEGQPPEVNTITFYTTPSDADAGINPITNPEAYISDTATVYYRTERLEGCYTVGYLNLVVTPFMGTDDIFFTGFSSYPNPVHDALYIKNNNVINSVTILNLLGQQVSHQNVNSINTMINMQSLSNGIYLIKVTSGEGEKTIKVVKE